jgi:hypothetical protein
MGDVLRLSDNIGSLLQLCPPCRRTILTKGLHKINGPIERRYGWETEWSCQLCSCIEQNRHPPVRSAISRVLEKISGRNSHRRHTTFNDMAEMIIYSTVATNPKFYQSINPISISKITRLEHSSDVPIVRLVPEKTIDFSLIRLWISTCEDQHEACQDKKQVKSTDMVPETNIVLIDVQKLRLVQTSVSARYLALSYIWGELQQLKLTDSNLVELQKEQSLVSYWHEIPQVIKDAIEAVRQLKEKYLWVDALCIVQDGENFHFNASHMDEIYGRSLCTIVAIDSRHANDSLPGVRPHTRRYQTAASMHSLLISRKRPELATICSSSLYETRSWTLQERLLSLRCLYFTNEQVYFHCQTELWSEDRYEHYMQTPDLVGWYTTFQHPSRSAEPTGREKTLAYQKLVHEYTKRNLSYDTDRYNAFMGIQNAYGNKWEWSFICGIPIQALVEGLLWISIKDSEKRIPSARGSRQFPSWSWIGWSGGVFYLPLEIASNMEQCSITTESGTKILETHSTPTSDSHPTSIGNLASSHSQIRELHDPPFYSQFAELSFYTWVVDTGAFQFQSNICESRRHPSGPLANRIRDHQDRACGLLFASTTEWFSQSDLRYKTALASLGSTEGPSTAIVEDAIGTDEFERDEPNIYDKYYSRHTNRTVYAVLLSILPGEIAERIGVVEINEKAWLESDPKYEQIVLK